MVVIFNSGIVNVITVIVPFGGQQRVTQYCIKVILFKDNEIIKLN